ncbi:MAG: dihydrofolate reductase [Burkholderiales bacterium]|nr:dihydrofolate reductase [Burkholderiales bacterium]
MNTASLSDLITPTPSMPLVLIAALAKNRVIGNQNALIWRIPEDLKRFKAQTRGHSIIMGRKTWASLGRALPERQNIVLTRADDTSDFIAANATPARSLEDAIQKSRLPLPIFCIGGGEIYRLALPRASFMLLTEIDADFDGDTTFPSFSNKEWEIIRREPKTDAACSLNYAFVTYRRVHAP